jgi:hypothetical protein
VTALPGQPAYSERLWPSLWVWVLALVGVGALATAYGSALGPIAAAVVAGIGTAVVIGLVVRSATRVVVDTDGLRAGRALLPWQFAGRAVPLDGEQSRIARGPQGDPSAYLLTRPGVGPGSVVVEVTDPVDPHRTWLIATRDPHGLARAIDEARGRLAA